MELTHETSLSNKYTLDLTHASLFVGERIGYLLIEESLLCYTYKHLLLLVHSEILVNIIVELVYDACVICAFT